MIEKNSQPLRVKEDFFDELINGLSTADERQKFDADKTKTYLSSKQRSYFYKKTLPIILAAQRKQQFLLEFFQKIYQNHKKKTQQEYFFKGVLAYKMFKLYDDQWSELEQKREAGTLGKLLALGRTYRRIKTAMKFRQMVRQVRQKVNIVFQKYRYMDAQSQGDKIERMLYHDLQDLQQPLISGLKKVIYPIYHQVYKMIDQKLTVTKQFWMYILKSIFWFDEDDPVDIALTLASYGLMIIEILSAIAGFITGGTAWFATAGAGAAHIAIIGAKLAKVGLTATKFLKAAAKLRKLSKSINNFKKATRAIRRSKRTQAALRRLKSAVHTYMGIDLYNVDTEDILEMNRGYLEVSKRKYRESLGNLTTRLRNIGQGLSFVDEAFDDINNEIHMSMLHGMSGGGIVIKRFQKLYDTVIHVNFKNEQMKNVNNVLNAVSQKMMKLKNYTINVIKNAAQGVNTIRQLAIPDIPAQFIEQYNKSDYKRYSATQPKQHISENPQYRVATTDKEHHGIQYDRFGGFVRGVTLHFWKNGNFKNETIKGKNFFVQICNQQVGLTDTVYVNFDDIFKSPHEANKGRYLWDIMSEIRNLQGSILNQQTLFLQNVKNIEKTIDAKMNQK